MRYIIIDRAHRTHIVVVDNIGVRNIIDAYAALVAPTIYSEFMADASGGKVALDSMMDSYEPIAIVPDSANLLLQIIAARQ